MSEPVVAPGLTADWLNAWLAALGITILVPGMRLSWTDDVVPVAQFHHADAGTIGAIASVIAIAFPDEATLNDLAIAPSHLWSAVPFARKVTPEAYADRANLDRLGYSGLGSVVTDLVAANSDGSMQTSAFYAAGPGTVGSIFDRVFACRAAIADPRDGIAKTLWGTAARIDKFGLGFDYRRITSPTDPNGGNWIDPVVEVLAFFGLLYLPVRGLGSLDAKRRSVTRGWSKSAGRTGAFTWPAWHPPLDAAGVDAALDVFWASDGKAPAVNWVQSQFESVPYRPLATADPTRGYGARRKR